MPPVVTKLSDLFTRKSNIPNTAFQSSSQWYSARGYRVRFAAESNTTYQGGCSLSVNTTIRDGISVHKFCYQLAENGDIYYQGPTYTYIPPTVCVNCDEAIEHNNPI